MTSRAAHSCVLFLGCAVAVTAPAGGARLSGVPAVDLAALPLAFEANRGQADPRARWLARGTAYSMAFTDEGVLLRLRVGGKGRTVLRLEPWGGSAGEPTGEEPLAETHHYLSLDGAGPDIADVPSVARLRYAEVFPGIDFVYHGDGGALELDVVVRPGGDPDTIGLRIAGGAAATIGDDGALVLGTGEGGPAVRFRAPRAYQSAADGSRRVVASAFRLDGDRVGFTLGDYDRRRELVIDPVLVYSTYLGGGGDFFEQTVRDLWVDASGQAYVVGVTESPSFPVAGAGACDDELDDNLSFNGCAGSPNGNTDAFVTKLNAAGTGVIYSTYLGGALSETANAVVVDAAGEAYVAGSQVDPTGGEPTRQAFLVRMRADGSGALFATVFGDAGFPDAATDLAIDAAGDVYVGGATASPGFNPGGVPGVDQTYGGAGDGFVRKYVPAAAPTYDVLAASTYVGGALFQDVRAIALGTDGSLVVGGLTYGVDNVAGDLYLVRLDAALTGVVNAGVTYSGSGSDEMLAVQVDGSNRVWLGGETFSSDFCDGVAAGLDHSFAGPSDGFAARVSADLTTVDYCTYAGGAGCDRVRGIALSADHLVTLVGGTVPGAVACIAGFDDDNAFVLRLDTAPSQLLWSYSFTSGASSIDEATAVAIGPGDTVVFGGLASLSGFPVTPGAFEATYPGSRSGFVAKIDPQTRVSVTDVSGNEGNSGTHDFGFQVRLNGTPLDVVSYSLSTQDGTATQPSDYLPVSRTCASCFAPLGPGSRTENVTVKGDTTVEPDETFFLDLTSVSANAVIGDGQGLGTILNDDAPPGTLQLSASTFTVGEGAGSAALTVTRVGGSAGAASVHCVTVAGGTATAGSDYTAVDVTLSWAVGDATAKTCSVPIAGDTLDEADETVLVQLQNASGATLGSPAAATLTITDDDTAGAIRWQAATFTASEAVGTFNLVATRTGGAASGATASYAVTGGTATGGGVDYTLAAGMVTFGANQTTVNVPVTIVGDGFDEANETVVVALSGPGGGATIGSPASTTLTITDDDTAGAIQWQSATFSAAESAGAFNLVVTRTGGAASGASASYAVTGGTATGGGVDYTLVAGVVHFGASQATANVPVTLVGDSLDEADETLVVTLSSPGGGATIGSPAGTTLTIVDDDTAGVLLRDGFESGDTSAWSAVAP